MNDHPRFDSIGVVLRKDKYGKFSSHRVFILDGVVLGEEQITGDRAQTPALKEALLDLELVSQQLHRHKLRFDHEDGGL